MPYKNLPDLIGQSSDVEVATLPLANLKREPAASEISALTSDKDVKNLNRLAFKLMRLGRRRLRPYRIGILTSEGTFCSSTWKKHTPKPEKNQGKVRRRIPSHQSVKYLRLATTRFQSTPAKMWPFLVDCVFQFTPAYRQAGPYARGDFLITET